MMDLTGFLTINGKDIFTEYAAFLAETSAEDHTNMDNLLAVPASKEITSVDFRERTGEDYPDNPDVQLSSIDRTLQFALKGVSEADRLAKYQAMMKLLVSGWLTFTVKSYRSYRMIYKAMDSEPAWYADRGDGAWVIFKVQFHEPKPEI